MRKNIIKVKKFQKPLICLIGILIFVLGMTVEKIIKANADEINYEYQSNNIEYDSTNNSLSATNVKDAIDELYSKVGKCPSGIYCYVENKSFEKAYVYDESTCITGDESGCVETKCYESGTCSVGTIVDYLVDVSTVVRFHVLHDDGETMTMQSQKNTVYNTAWQTSGNHRDGPVTIMAALKTATNGWSNVKNITLADGITQFNDGTSANNKCTETSCDSYISGDNGYSYSRLVNNASIGGSVKARMITITETAALGCTISHKSCPIYLYNYLRDSVGQCRVSGKCTNDTYAENGVSHNQGYWTMGANSSSTYTAWDVYYGGGVTSNSITDTNFGARAVVVVDK